MFDGWITRSGLAALAMFAPFSAATAEDCTLKKLASVPASFEGDRLLIQLRVNDQPAQFLLDTGSWVTAISASFAKSLGLQPTKLDRGRGIVGIDGIPNRDGVAIGLKIDQLVAANDIVPVVGQSDNGSSDPWVGRLGMDHLRQYDVEIDPAQGVVNLYSPDHCPGKVVYWASEWFELPLNSTGDRQPTATVALDGQSLDALIDTGGTGIYLDVATAQLMFGVSTSDPDAKPAGTALGLGGGEVRFWSRNFQSLVFGSITMRNPRILLRSLGLPRTNAGSHITSHGAPFAIGMSLLGKFHSYFAFGEDKLYFTLAAPTSVPISASRPG